MNEVLRSSQVALGQAGPRVFRLALGCMGMSGMYGSADERESVATIHAALERGVSLFDSGDFYGMGQNELLLGRALAGKRERAILSVKFGALREPGGGWTGVDNRPAAIKNYLCYSLTRLGVDSIDVYRPARLDPNVPIEETVGVLSELVQAGYMRAIGLSEVGVDTIRRASAVHPIADLQIEYSLVSRGPERAIFPVLAELGVAVTAYGVLSRGLLSGSAPRAGQDFRAHLPRFSGENGAHNRRLVQALAEVAGERGLSASQLAIAWVLSKGESIVPVIGARTREQLSESLGALDVSLSPAEVRRLESLVASCNVRGERYQAAQMSHLDSER